MENEKVIDVLDDLVETCRDGQKGYREAAEHVKDPELRTFFNQQSSERGRFVTELQSELRRLGEEEPEDSGSVAGALNHTWLDLKASLGGGDTAILNSVEQGEDSAKEAYQEALAEPLPESVLLIIRRQSQSVIAAHDRVNMLRDRRKAA
jgi:uncharacterized protein (TIGR02284 family)